MRIDPLDQRPPTPILRGEYPNAPLATDHEIPAIGRERKSRPARQRIALVDPRFRVVDVQRSYRSFRTMLDRYPRKSIGTQRIRSLRKESQGLTSRIEEQLGSLNNHAHACSLSKAESKARWLGEKSIRLTKAAASRAPNSRSIPLSSHSTLKGPS